MFTAARLYALHQELLAFMDEYGSDADPSVADAARVVSETADKEYVLEHPDEHVEQTYFGKSA